MANDSQKKKVVHKWPFHNNSKIIEISLKWLLHSRKIHFRSGFVPKNIYKQLLQLTFVKKKKKKTTENSPHCQPAPACAGESISTSILMPRILA